MSHCTPFSSGEPSFSPDNKSFDVFLSFRGPDTRHGFVRRLYGALLEQGIQTFLDQESLEKGDHIPTTLERGIKESRIWIPILSKRFPESKWCLKEVSLMVKSGVKICPLFYDVLPNVLRCREGRDGSDYAEHFKKHENQNGLSAELIVEYKNALESVSNLCGWYFNQFNDSDEDLIREVVIDVKKSLLSKAYLDIPKCFGLNWSVEHLRDIINGLFLEKKKTVKVGLHGMCGIDKTTLAKIVCKKFPFSQFQAFSFVPSVGERCQEANGLVKLQTQMLRDVSSFKGEVSYVDQGKGLLQNCLLGKKALLLLDDIESCEQLDALGGVYKGFGAGSCVIITSRDERILKVVNVDQVYEVRRLCHKLAMELFNFHAFPNSCSSPDDPELQALSSDIVSACENDKDVWKEMDPQEKAKLVRCFMYEPKQPMTLRAEMFKSLYNMQFLRLTDVSIQGHFSGEFFMDLRWLSLRNYSSKRLPQGMNLQNLVILEVTHSQIIHLWDETTQENPTTKPGNLKELILRGCESLKSLPATLCYTLLQMLDLHNCHSLSSLPNTVKSWTSLVNLDMEGCSVSSLPEDFGELANLQELNLSYCHHLSNLPDTFGNLAQRKRLEIHHNDNLAELPNSFGDLKALVYLDAGCCHSLSRLSDNVGSLISLVYLKMGECGVSSLPQDFCNLGNLRVLNLSYCQDLSKLPDSFGNLKNLRYLDLSGCMELMKLPVSFEDLTYLYELNLHGCSKLALQSYVLENRRVA